MKSKIEINNLNYTIGDQIIFEEANLNIEFDTLYLLGRNGCGKSTLLNLIFNSIRKYNIRINGKIMKKNDIAYIQQELCLFDELTVKRNLSLLKFDKPDVLDYIYECDLVDKKLSKLSGGERQIVNICCGLASPGKLLLIDEPFNHLSNNRQKVIEKLINEDERPKIIVTHKNNSIEGNVITIKQRGFVYE